MTSTFLPSPPQWYCIFSGYNLRATHSHRFSKSCFPWNSGKIKQMYFSSQEKYAGHTLGWVAAASYKKRYFCPFVLVFFLQKSVFSFESLAPSHSQPLRETKVNPHRKKIIFTHSHDKSPCVKVKLFPGEKYNIFAPPPQTLHP